MKHSLWSTFLLIAVCVLSQSAFAQSAYRLTRIGGDDSPMPTFVLSAFDLNDRGEVVGAFNGLRTSRAFIWRNGVLTTIDDATTSTGEVTAATAINDRGDAIGQNDRPFLGPIPVLISDGQIIELKAFSDVTSVFPVDNGFPIEITANAVDINSRRQITGNASVSADLEFAAFPFLQTGSRLIRLNPLPNVGNSGLSAFRLNELGVVVGQQDIGLTIRGVLWVGSRPIDLGVLPGESDSSAFDINDFNEVVGRSGPRAILWRKGRMTELVGIDSGSSSRTLAFGINNRRQVIGSQLQLDTWERMLLLWERDGRVFDLNELISDDDPLKPFVKLTDSLRINNRGQILTLGRDSRTLNEFEQPYLLTPIP